MAGIGDDTLTGTEGNDTISGLGGDDVLRGLGGADKLDGGADDDRLEGGTGTDILRGGTGNDLIYAGTASVSGTSNEQLYGDAGNDRLFGTGDGSYLDGGTGNDIITGGRVSTALGGDGDDVISVTGVPMVASQPTLIDGGDGFDELRLIGSNISFNPADGLDFTKVANIEKIVSGDFMFVTLADVNVGADGTLFITSAGSNGAFIRGAAELDGHLDITGTNTRDELWGGQQSDIIRGGNGDDQLRGAGGDDVLNGGDGVDTAIFSGNFADYTITEGDGFLIVEGADGEDTLFFVNRLQFDDQTIDIEIPGVTLNGDGGANTLTGGEGKDTLSGLGGNDTLRGGLAADLLNGGADNDLIEGGAGVDELRGGAGNDAIYAHAEFEDGSASGEKLYGEAGNDQLFAENRDAYLDGGIGDDVIHGGRVDTALGGDGDDIIHINNVPGHATQPTLIDGGDGYDELHLLRGYISLNPADYLDYSAVRNFEKIVVNDVSLITLANVNVAAGEVLTVATTGDWSLFFDAAAELDGHLFVTGGGVRDEIAGGQQDDIIYGFGGDDLLRGNGGDDTIHGGDGIDTVAFSGDRADYVVVEGAGFITVTGADGEDTLYFVNRLQFADQIIDIEAPGLTLTGDGGVNTLVGGEGKDTISGLGGNDILRGGLSADLINGGADNDRIEGGAGVDELHGGAGNDVIYAHSEFDAGSATGEHLYGEAGDDQLFNEKLGAYLDGGIGNDILRTGQVDTALGGDGDDVISINNAPGLANQPTLIDGGDGYDELRAGGGISLNPADFLDYSCVVNIEKITIVATTFVTLANVNVGAGGTLVITSPNQGAFIDGAAELDGHLSITGSDTRDEIAGGQQSDVIHGEDGDDLLRGNGGDDIIYGSDGVDTAVFSGNFGDYVITEGDGFLTVSGADGVDKLYFVNRLQFDDQTFEPVIPGVTLVGTDRGDNIGGTEGDDTLNGLGGADTLTGADGDDTADGGAGNDLIVGGSGLGDDVYIGGAGVDTVRYSSAIARIDVDLTAGTASGANIGTDSLSGLENIIGGAGGDFLYGSTAANEITSGGGADLVLGRNGNDSLNGGLGNDILNGGIGRDTLTGGGGADRFVLDQASTSLNVDKITDFTRNSDKIQLDRDVFTKLGAMGALSNAAFFAGANAHDKSDRIVYDPRTGDLFYDANGSQAGQKVLIATLDDGLKLSAGDFQVI